MTEPTPLARPKPRSGLGRGLNALMGDLAREEPVGEDKGNASPGVRSLPVGSLAPHPGQPRHLQNPAWSRADCSDCRYPPVV